jgi:hypothetical protein
MATINPINVGTNPDDGFGDPLRSAFIKINSNESIINSELILKEEAPLNRVVVNSAADFPTPVAGKIILVANTEYYIGSNTVSVADEFTLAENVTFKGSVGPSLLTYTGIGSMFEGDGLGNFQIQDLTLNLPNGGSVFNIVDTVQDTIINVRGYRILDCGSLGVVTNVTAFIMEYGIIFNMDQGIQLSGNLSIISIDKMFGFSTSATFKLIDLSTSVAPTVEFLNLAITAPAGAVGIKGLINSGNIPVNSIASVDSCEFLGGMDSLENITTSDIRWQFTNNSTIIDTSPDALGSVDNNLAETIIGVATTPVKINVNSTMVSEASVHFTVGVDGRVTYNGEKPIAVPIDAIIGITSVGGSPDASVFIAVNGVVVTPHIPIVLSSSKPTQLATMWQHVFLLGDYVEIFVANETNTTNLVVESVVFRIR